jgi:hypothetical protein
MKRVGPNTPGQADLVREWKRAVDRGDAGARCDDLVRRRHLERGVPLRLANALLRVTA